MKPGAALVWRWGEPLEPIRAILERGGVVAVPTESSYALAVDPRSRAGVEEIFRIKGREANKPLPVVAADLAQLEELGVEVAESRLRRLASAWPAPLTVVVPLARQLPACAGGRTLAIRIPGHRRLRELLRGLGHPLTATSANRSGEPPVLDPAELRPLLTGHDALVVDGGRLAGGAPSTMVAIEAGGLALLRQGSYPWRRLEALFPEISRLGAEPTGVAEALANEPPVESR